MFRSDIDIGSLKKREQFAIQLRARKKQEILAMKRQHLFAQHPQLSADETFHLAQLKDLLLSSSLDDKQKISQLAKYLEFVVWRVEIDPESEKYQEIQCLLLMCAPDLRKLLGSEEARTTDPDMLAAIVNELACFGDSQTVEQVVGFEVLNRIVSDATPHAAFSTVLNLCITHSGFKDVLKKVLDKTEWHQVSLA